MPYTIKMVCDLCGVECDVPARTLAELAQVAYGFIIRVSPLIRLHVPPGEPVETKCPRCSQLPPEPGVVRVGEL